MAELNVRSKKWPNFLLSRPHVKSEMTIISILIWRHLRVFWRDRLTVFFSFLAPVSLWGLFVLFLRKQYADVVQTAIPGSSHADAYALVDAWVFASIVTLASFTGALGMLNSFVDDRMTGRFSDYLVTPVKRWQLGVSYVVVTVIVAFVISMMFLVSSQLWALGFGQATMSWAQVGTALWTTALACLIFSAFNIFIVTLLGSQGAFNGYAITMGTAIGFLAYCYVPPSGLSTPVNNVLGVLPFAETASLIRDPVMAPATDRILSMYGGDVYDQARSAVQSDLGVTLTVSGHLMPEWLIVVILFALFVIFASLLPFRMGRIIH